MRRVLVVLLAGCSGGGATHVDAQATDASADAAADATIDAPRLTRVTGHVDYMGSLVGVPVMLLGNAPQQTVTDSNGDYYFDVPLGSRMIVEVMPAAGSGLYPMIRGIVVDETPQSMRPRVFYLMGDSDVTAAQSLGKTFQAGAAIAEIDFRNATIAGYTAALTDTAGHAVSPSFGIVYDDTGTAVQGTATVAGGDGSTLLLAGLPASQVSFTPVLPSGATLPCKPDDAQPLPLVPDATTWFDFECGTGTD